VTSATTSEPSSRDFGEDEAGVSAQVTADRVGIAGDHGRGVAASRHSSTRAGSRPLDIAGL